MPQNYLASALDTPSLFLKTQTNTQNLIPRRIFQTWKDKQHLPPLYKRFSDTIRQINSHYHYDLWDDHDNRQFIQNNYPWFLEIYDSYDQNIKRVDAIRYFYLYHYGGIYLDMDAVTLKPLDQLIEKKSLVFGFADKHHYEIPNAIMASTARHPFFLYVINILTKTKHLPVLEATGPVFLKACLQKWDLLHNSEVVLPFPLLYTHPWNDKPQYIKDPMSIQEWKQYFPYSFTTTVWTHSWKS